MPKKLLVFLLLSCSLALLLPTTSSAACRRRTGFIDVCVQTVCPQDPYLCCSTKPECDQAAKKAETEKSPFCNDDPDQGVKTALGCLKAGQPKEFIGQILGWGVSIGGGIAFLLIVYAGFQIATAAGDLKRIQAARELLVSAISGLILIVLSVVLLNFIGVKILALPGFNL